MVVIIDTETQIRTHKVIIRYLHPMVFDVDSNVIDNM